MKQTIIFLTLFSVAIFAQQKGTFTDPRDNKTYKTVKIGEQIWMTENLNYNASGSECGSDKYFPDKVANCKKYGRLYNWKTAVKSCPKGWHLPDNEEWQKLMNFAGGNENAGTKLKAKSGWKDNDNGTGNGTDNYGFSALPGGLRHYNGNFIIGNSGFWWSSSESKIKNSVEIKGSSGNGSTYAYARYISVNEETGWSSLGNNYLLSIRCMQD